MGEEEQFDYSDDESDMQDNDSVEEADASVGGANDSEYDIASVSYVSDEDGSFSAQETQPSGRRRVTHLPSVLLPKRAIWHSESLISTTVCLQCVLTSG